jgi:hypothetical protein
VPEHFRSARVRARGVKGSRNGDADDEALDLDHVCARVEGEDVMTWLTSDMSMYVTIVTDTVSTVLPKMAVMVMLERIVENQLMRALQKMAISVRLLTRLCWSLGATKRDGALCCVDDN